MLIILPGLYSALNILQNIFFLCSVKEHVWNIIRVSIMHYVSFNTFWNASCRFPPKPVQKTTESGPVRDCYFQRFPAVMESALLPGAMSAMMKFGVVVCVSLIGDAARI